VISNRSSGAPPSRWAASIVCLPTLGATVRGSRTAAGRLTSSQNQPLPTATSLQICHGPLLSLIQKLSLRMLGARVRAQTR
jgi:hypothetical protein